MILENSSAKILFLLNNLLNGEYSTVQLMELFKKANCKISRAALSNYINILKKAGFTIETINVSKEKKYFIKNIKRKVQFTNEEIKILNNSKKLFALKTNFYQLRHLMALYYRLALLLDEKDENRFELINFEYYSKLNWELIDILDKHCRNKDKILLEYIAFDNETRLIPIHAEKIIQNEAKNRMYVKCVIEGQNKFSILPVDKIFIVKEVIQEHVQFEMNFDVLNYKVAKEAYSEIPSEKEETIAINEKFVSVKRPIDDSFHIVQRLLQFCPDLYNISDENIKNKIKEKLKILKNKYECIYDY